MPALRQSRPRQVWDCAEREAEVPLSQLWTAESRESRQRGLFHTTARRNPARLSRTQQLARTGTYVRCCPQYRAPVAKKKAEQLPPLRKTLIPLEPRDSSAPVLELDELWSFVCKKINQVWVWFALCRKTRQIVAFVLGDRSEATCRKLWHAIPPAYRHGICYTDFWAAYQAVIPPKQHRPVGKETGETAHVERFNNTLRQRLARFVRKTLSFSKSRLMHEICLRLFIWRYNMNIRQKYMQSTTV